MRVMRIELEFFQLDMKYSGLRIVEAGSQGRLIASLAEHGQQFPVLVVESGEGRYVLIDGYRRVEGLKRLSRDTVMAVVLPMGEAEALMFGHQQHNSRMSYGLEEGWLVRELKDMHGMSLGEIAIGLGRSKSWVSRRLGLVEGLPEEVQELVRKGKLCAYAAGKYLVPLARANRRDCIHLAKRIGKEKSGVRDIESMYVAWRKADKKGRKMIVLNPHLYLKAKQEIRRPSEVLCKGGNEEQILNDLGILRGVCHRLLRLLGEGGLGVVDGFSPKKLKGNWEEVLSIFERLSESFEEVLDAE